MSSQCPRIFSPQMTNSISIVSSKLKDLHFTAYIYIIIRTFIRNVWLTIRRINIYILEVKTFNVNSGVQEKFNRNLTHFYLARHFIGTISLYLDFFLLTVVVFVFDSIVIVNRFLLCIYCNVCTAHLIIFIENAYYYYYYYYYYY